MQLAILPAWWEEECGSDADLLPEIELRVARFLGETISQVRNPEGVLSAPGCAGAQLRRIRDVDRDRLAPAIHAALQIGGAVVRNLRDSRPGHASLPPDGLEWRRTLLTGDRAVAIDDLLGDLWQRGIPVIPLDVLPAPSFQGMACIVEGRPVILLGHKHDEPGRVAFFVAHEAAHVASGDCTLGRPIVDEEDLIVDEAQMERAADRFATQVLTGRDDSPGLEGGNFRDLAKQAVRLDSETGAEASILIFAWAAKTGDYATATMAVKALYRGSGARHQLRDYFDRYVNRDTATETDRALLRCVHGNAGSDETAD